MATYPPLLVDFFIVVGLVAFGAASMLAAYRLGGETWVTRFAVRPRVKDKDQCFPLKAGKSWVFGLIVLPESNSNDKVPVWPGQFAEGLFLFILASALCAIDYLTSDVTLIGFIKTHPVTAGIGALFIFLLTVIYSCHICQQVHTQGTECLKPAQDARKLNAYVRELRRGYRVYNFYSTVNFGLGFSILLLLFLQHQASTMQFVDHREELGQLYAALSEARSGGSQEIQLAMELIYAAVLNAISLSIDEVGKGISVLVTIFAVIALLTMSPFQNVYEGKAILISVAAGLLLLAIALGLGGLIFLNEYAAIINEALRELKQAQDSMITASEVRRFGEITRDLVERGTFSAFLNSSLGTWGGYATLATLIGLLAAIGPFVTRTLGMHSTDRNTRA